MKKKDKNYSVLFLCENFNDPHIGFIFTMVCKYSPLSGWMKSKLKGVCSAAE